MNKQELLSMSEDERVMVINDMLKEDSVTKVEDVANRIGMSSSSLGKLMTEGSYCYSRAFKQYVLRESKKVTMDKNEIVKYIQENYQTIKRLVEKETKNENNVLVLSQEVVQVNSEYVIRNTKVPKNVNDQFTKLCEEKYQYLKLQDILGQAMWEFIEKYR